VSDVGGEGRQQARIRFAVLQWIDAAAPATSRQDDGSL
jgi:hypothetical protein